MDDAWRRVRTEEAPKRRRRRALDRVVLVAFAPEREEDLRRPLIDDVSGALLRKLSGAATVEQYVSWFERLYLLRRAPSIPGFSGRRFAVLSAREAAFALLPELRGRRVILLGRTVARAFGLRREAFPPFAWVERHGAEFALLPPPTPLHAFWRSYSNRASAARFFGSVVSEILA